MLYSSSGGSRPRRVPRADRRWEMARRPERRPISAATNPTSTQSGDGDDEEGDLLGLAQVDVTRRTQRHAPNMTGPGPGLRTFRSAAARADTLVSYRPAPTLGSPV